MNVTTFKSGGWFRWVYFLTLLGISVYVFALFVRPVEGVHSGLNNYHRSKFLDMVNGTAYKPFVYRTLFPTTIRILSAVTPTPIKQAFAATAQSNRFVRERFRMLFWETTAAYEYGLASTLMVLCFMGFAHTAAQYTLSLCQLAPQRRTRLFLVVSVLLGLPFFFRYTAYPYDPLQLFLFTLALFFLATSRLRAFVITFVFCCINKETAVLLIPLFAVIGRKQDVSSRQYQNILFGLIGCYVSIKTLITLLFWNNPGSFVEFQWTHNLEWFQRGLSFTHWIVFISLGWLVFYQWRSKPAFLKWAFVCTLPPLMILALFLGYFDEWRGYYEAYPTVFALSISSLYRLKSNWSLAHAA
jgi:hypothetical protein